MFLTSNLIAENKLAVSYGLSIIAANVLYTANVIWDKNVTDFTFVDWGTIAANTGIFGYFQNRSKKFPFSFPNVV